MSMLLSLLAHKKTITYPLLGALAAGGLLLLTPHLTLAEGNPHQVPAAEVAVQDRLPEGAKIVGSRLINDQEAEVMIEAGGQINPVIMKLTPSGWQQNMAATLARGAMDMQSLAEASQLSPDSLPPAFGQTGSESVLQSTQDVSNLLPPADVEQETQRALSGSGRSDPFEPLDQVIVPPDPGTLPPLPTVPPAPTTQLPPRSVPDPAAFAKNVQLTGIIQIDQDSYALMSAKGVLPTVVQAGQNYESAAVAKISSPRKEVILQEAGQTIVKPIDASISISTPLPSPSPETVQR